MFQILDPHGELVGAAPDLDDDRLVDMYRRLITTRIADEKLLNLQRQGRMAAYYQVSGQEAHVGAALALRDQDWIFTAYRELGLWIARGMSTLSVVGFWLGIPDDDDIWDVQRYRITRLNATIGTHLPHAVGFGHAERLGGRDTVTMAVFGDGATSEPDFHAAANFAGVWKAPTVFLCQNNQVAQSTTIDKQTASAGIAAKADAYGFAGVLVDGMDPLAMYEATRGAVQRAASGDGPTLIEMHTYRFAPHSTYDGTPVYRSSEEEAAWRARDPVLRMRTFLEHKGLWDASEEQTMRERLSAELEAAVDELEARPAVARDYSPRQLFARMPPALAEQLRREQRDLGEPAAAIDDGDLWLISDEHPAERSPERHLEEAGPTERVDMTGALNMTLHSAMQRDPSVMVLGEDVALEGGVFRITEGLHDAFGPERVIDTPLCETGIIGTSVGMAMAGLRPVAEIEFAGFVYSAFDQIIGHVGRLRWRYRGRLTAPVVVRLPVGTNLGNYEFHVDSPEAFFVHAPGLVVLYPSNPYDAKGLLEAALRSEDPVIFLEPVSLYRGLHGEVPVAPYTIPIGRAAVRREGRDATVVTWGPPVHAAAVAAAELDSEGVSVEVIDLRTLYPWDRETVLASVERTGRLVVAHEAQITGGVGAEIVAGIAEHGAYLLDAPPVRVGHMDVFWGTTQLEHFSKITPARIAAGVRRALAG